MRVGIVAIGRMKQGPERELVARYLDRATASGKALGLTNFAVADQMITALREAGYGKPRVEGLPHCDWVLVDAGDVIVHIFRPEVREFYNIEKMWQADFAADAH